MAQLLRTFAQTGQNIQNTLHLVGQAGIGYRGRAQRCGSGPVRWRCGDDRAGIGIAILSGRHHGPQRRRRRNKHRGRKAPHAVVISLGIPKHNAFHRKAPHFAAPFTQAHGQRGEVGVARGNRKKPDALLKMQRDGIGNQGGIGGVFLQRQIGKGARAQITPHRLQPLQARPGTIRAAHADPARIGVQFSPGGVDGLRVGKIVRINQQRRLLRAIHSG